MGSQLSRRLLKPFRSINVDNRAQKVISKEKPAPAPRYETRTPSVPDSVKKEIRSKILSKNELLSNRLRDVRVVSEGENPEIKRREENLPRSREQVTETRHGFIEPKVIPKGKMTLSQVVSLLAKHYGNPKAYKAEDAAKEFEVDLQEAEKILQFYMPLTMLDTRSAADMEKLGTKTTLELVHESQEPCPPYELESAIKETREKKKQEEEEKKKKGLI